MSKGALKYDRGMRGRRHYESDLSSRRRIYNSGRKIKCLPLSSRTRVCLLPTGASAYVSGITELIFKVCFGDGAPCFFLFFLDAWLSPVMLFQLSCYIIWIRATAEIKESCEPLALEVCGGMVHVICIRS